jgi:tRNA (guanine9-N1)-methyltransferase
MTEKEINSLASQIRYCYAYNRRATHPVYLSVTSLSGTTRNVLEKVDGFPDSWVGRGFSHHTDAMEKVHDLSRLVYLTSDSPNVINDLDDTKIYVIGGIVDRNRLKRATVTRAEQLGIATAKLPINEFLDLTATNVLTCNHVFDILMKFKENGKDWKKSFLEVLPERKDAHER